MHWPVSCFLHLRCILHPQGSYDLSLVVVQIGVYPHWFQQDLHPYKEASDVVVFSPQQPHSALANVLKEAMGKCASQVILYVSQKDIALTLKHFLEN